MDDFQTLYFARCRLGGALAFHYNARYCGAAWALHHNARRRLRQRRTEAAKRNLNILQTLWVSLLGCLVPAEDLGWRASFVLPKTCACVRRFDTLTFLSINCPLLVFFLLMTGIYPQLSTLPGLDRSPHLCQVHMSFAVCCFFPCFRLSCITRNNVCNKPQCEKTKLHNAMPANTTIVDANCRQLFLLLSTGAHPCPCNPSENTQCRSHLQLLLFALLRVNLLILWICAFNASSVMHSMCSVSPTLSCCPLSSSNLGAPKAKREPFFQLTAS